MQDSEAARAIYAQLWSAALAEFNAGNVRLDPHLDQRASDTRRGLTLVLRPGDEAKAPITDALDDLRQIAPDQHFYHPDELHITVLSVVSAASNANLDAIPLAAYRAAFAGVFAQTAPFTVHMTGLTAAPDAVFVCGETDGDALNRMRDRLRDALHSAGLADHLERRYRSVTTHMTVMRFRTVPARLDDLARYLDSTQRRNVGSFIATHCDFVCNDWYMSRDITRLLDRYPLAGARAEGSGIYTED